MVLSEPKHPVYALMHTVWDFPFMQCLLLIALSDVWIMNTQKYAALQKELQSRVSFVKLHKFKWSHL